MKNQQGMFSYSPANTLVTSYSLRYSSISPLPSRSARIPRRSDVSSTSVPVSLLACTPHPVVGVPMPLWTGSRLSPIRLPLRSSPRMIGPGTKLRSFQKSKGKPLTLLFFILWRKRHLVNTRDITRIEVTTWVLN